MNNQALTIEYNGVVITYDESTSKFMFILRGRERSADSLRAAKETIDKPAPKEKTFVSTPAYLKSYDGIRECVVTNTAERGRYDSAPQYWVTCDGRRTKQDSTRLVAKTPENEASILKIFETQKEIERLSEEARDLKEKLTRFSEQ